jgi:hypothetical protein
VDTEVDSLHVKRIDIENLVGYVYMVRLDNIDEISPYEISIENNGLLILWAS